MARSRRNELRRHQITQFGDDERKKHDLESNSSARKAPQSECVLYQVESLEPSDDTVDGDMVRACDAKSCSRLKGFLCQPANKEKNYNKVDTEDEYGGPGTKFDDLM
jgi:hypothetical protein